MIQTVDGFVLREIRYGDTSSIVKVYTREKGIRSFMIRGLRSSRSKIKKAGLFPLSEMEFTYLEQHENQEISRVQQHRPAQVYKTLYADVAKSSILVFLAELLSKCLPQGQVEEGLYEYIQDFLAQLDQEKGRFGHYHLCFMLDLSRFIGCYPRVGGYGAQASMVFDLREGGFCEYASHKEVIEQEEGGSLLKKILLDPQPTTLASLNAQERASVLQLLLQYYRIQMSLPEMKSFRVLKEVFQS